MPSGYQNHDGYHVRIDSYVDRFDWFHCNCPHKLECHYWVKEKGIIQCEEKTGLFSKCDCKMHYCEGTEIITGEKS